MFPGASADDSRNIFLAKRIRDGIDSEGRGYRADEDSYDEYDENCD